MPAGTNVPQGGGGGRRRGNPVGLPKFFLRTGEAAVVRALTRNDGQDGKVGWADVLLSRDYQWAPIPGAFDNTDIRLPEVPSYEEAIQSGAVNPQFVSKEQYIEDIIANAKGVPPGWQQKTQVALYVWPLRIFHTQQRPAPREGQTPRPPRQEITLSDQMLNFVNRPDKFNGKRFVEDYSSPAYWMKGPDFNQAFTNRLQTLTAELNGNLSSRNLLIVRREGATRGEFRSSDWVIVPCPEGIAELQVPMTDELRQKISGAYQLLPPIRDLFEGTLKWPPESERSVAWDDNARPAQAPAPAPQPVAPPPPVAPAPAPAPQVPPQYQEQYQPDSQPKQNIAPPPNVVAPPPPPATPAVSGTGSGGLADFLL